MTWTNAAEKLTNEILGFIRDFNKFKVFFFNVLFLYVSVENLAFYAGTFKGISGRSNHNHQHHCIGKLNLKSRHGNCIFISSDCL